MYIAPVFYKHMFYFTAKKKASEGAAGDDRIPNICSIVKGEERQEYWGAGLVSAGFPPTITA